MPPASTFVAGNLSGLIWLLLLVSQLRMYLATERGKGTADRDVKSYAKPGGFKGSIEERGALVDVTIRRRYCAS